MSRSKSWVIFILFGLSCMPLTAQRQTKVLEFSSPADENQRTLFGAIVRKDGSWQARTIGVAVLSLDRDEQSCRFRLCTLRHG